LGPVHVHQLKRLRMNRNVIKWLLIIAVIAGAAAYLLLDGGPGGKKEQDLEENTAVAETIDAALEDPVSPPIEASEEVPMETPEEITPVNPEYDTDIEDDTDAEDLDEDEDDFVVDDEVVEQMLLQMTQEHDGPLSDDGEASRLVIKKAKLAVAPFALYRGTPQEEAIRFVPDCGVRAGLVAEFEQKDIQIKYLGDQRWSVHCYTSYGNFNQENEGSSRVSASINFVYAKKGALAGRNGKREHLDGFFRITRKSIVQTGGEWFDYDEHRRVHRICTDQSAASGRFESFGGGYAVSGYTDGFSGFPESFSFMDKHLKWEDDQVGFKPYTTKVGMSDVRRAISKNSTDHSLVRLYLDFAFE